MPLTQLAPPYPIFTDKNGDPLDAGYLYFGVVNQNPETNPIQVYYDSAFTQPAAQPLRTSNGYVMRNGSPALIYADSQFSVTVRDKKGALVIYSPVGYGVDPASVSGTVIYDDFTGDGTTTIFTLTASPSTKNATNVYIDGIYQSKDNYNTVGSTLTFSTAPPLNSAIEVVSQESSIIGGASSQQITYNQGGSGAITRTVQSRLRDFVSVKDFGAVGDGVTDDTAAIQNAMTFCQANGKTLLVEGNILFKASSAGNITVISGDDYVTACSMVGFNEATITVDGSIGFNTAGVDQTHIEGIKFVTVNRELTEADLISDLPHLFLNGSGNKSSAVYRDLVILNTVTSSTGEYRGGSMLREANCDDVIFDNITVQNAGIAVTADACDRVTVRNLNTSNIQTSVFITGTTGSYVVDGVTHINTAQQSDYWIGRTAGAPVSFNGMDAVLAGGASTGIVTNVQSDFAIERCVYCTHGDVLISDCNAKNSDGFKVVGTGYNAKVKNAKLSNCHVLLETAFTASRSRVNNALGAFYWIDNVEVYGCTIENQSFSEDEILSFCTIGRNDGSTVDGVTFKDCKATYASRFVYVIMCSQTAAALAALSPAGSFTSAKNVTIENCYYETEDFRPAGSLYEHRTTGASADALATYASENVVIQNNSIVLPATAANRATWIFDVKYMNGCRSVANRPDRDFANNGFFSSAVTAPYQNLYFDEPYLYWSTDPGTLVTRLANLDAVTGSSMTFLVSSLANENWRVSTKLYATGGLDDGLVVVDGSGKDYATVANTSDFGIEMNAGGAFYIGKVISGSYTNQVSTPPLTLGYSSGIVIRGDLAPTTQWNIKLTKV